MPYIAPPFTPSVTISGTDLIRNTDEKLQTIANDVGDYLEVQSQAIYTDLDAQMTVIEGDYYTVLKPEIEQKMDDLLTVNPDGTYYTKSAIDILVASKVAKVTSTDNSIARFDGTTGAIQNSGVVVDDSGKFTNGLLLPNTAIANATTLDWYEEGTFTPVVIGNTTAGSCTYTQQKGQYTRIGNIVNFNIRLVWTAHTGTGIIRITGLPFPSNSSEDYNIGALSVTANSLTLPTSSDKVVAYLPNNTTIVEIASTTFSSGWTGITMDTSASIYISGSYRV